MKLDAVKALVTGAGGGLGRVFCRRLVESGAQVIGTDFDDKHLEETKKYIVEHEQRGKSSFHALKGNVTSEADVANLFAQAKDLMGGCNVLVNNAGLLRDRGLVKVDKATGKGVKGMSKQDWDSVLGVCLTGPFLCSREFAAQAIGEEKEGVIVNISSSARAGYPYQSNYSAAKAGLVADTVVWAKELSKYNIRVGAIAPGVIQTKILDSVPEEMKDRLIQSVPLKRLGDREEIWQGVKFVIECGYFTGRVLEIDGGLMV